MITTDVIDIPDEVDETAHLWWARWLQPSRRHRFKL